MVNPVPGYYISTPYKKRGPYWSCDEDSSGNAGSSIATYAAADLLPDTWDLPS